jgi:hypothetical protein
MAEVFKAKTFGVEGFERLLAVKRILPNIAEDEEFIAMFIDEAKIAVQLQHANIAQIFDLGKVEDSYFIALEHVHGKDLRSIFDRMRGKREVMPVQQACYITMQLCEGLDYAHNKRDAQGRELHLVHRDISPQNVLIGYEGEVKLIDFGIAKAAGKASKTQAGILKGKFGYMSPEQVRGLPIDRRSDIFSCGIVMYELLTNERLFVGESDFSTLEKVRNVEILPPSSYNSKIPEELERIVLKALAKDPEDRYQNAIDLHDDLQAFLHKIGGFYSRKDLAAWMKKVFAVEIEEDSAKLEQYRLLTAPEGAVETSVRRAAVGGAPPNAGAGRAAVAAKTSEAKKSEAKKSDAKGPEPSMDWDDEELDTQIFDKDDPIDVKQVSADDLFFEDDEHTVVNEPPPDILEQARPPGQAAAQRASAAAAAAAAAAAPAAPVYRAPPPSAKQTLMGVPAAPYVPLPSSRLTPPALPQLPHPGPPQGLAGLRRSGLNLPSPVLPPPTAAPQPVFSFDTSSRGGFTAPPPPRPSRAGRYLVLTAVAAGVIGGTVYWYQNANKAGQLQVTTVPSDATVSIDNVKVADHSPASIEKAPGSYTLSITKDGYVRSDQNVEIRAGQPSALVVTLEPSPDTGFELLSDPPGGLVWLDGAPLSSPTGQARTDFRASRIPPGHHVLEIKGESRFQPWKQHIEIEAGSIRKLRATLIPIEGGTHVAARTEPKPEPKPEPKAESKPEPKPEPTVVPPPVEPVAVAHPSAGTTRRRKPREASGDDVVKDTKPVESSGDCSITLGSRPWSEVWIDGKNTNRQTPFVDFKVACGKHKVTFKRADLQIDQPEVITVHPGEKFKQSYSLLGDE